MTTPFSAHLRAHSHFSLLRATPSVDALVAQAAADGLAALALTDHDALYGAVALARACRAAGIRPIIGMSVAVRLATPGAGHGTLLLLARNRAGYRSLCRLTTWLQGSAERDARLAHGVTPALLAENRAGLIAVDGGHDGPAATLARHDPDAALRFARWLAETYGDWAYLGLSPSQAAGAAAARRRQTAHDAGLPLLALQPVYVMDSAEQERLRLLAAVRLNVRRADVPPAALPDRGDAAVPLHWLSPAAMAERLALFPEALANVATVAEACGAALPSGRTLWPKLALPAGESAADALARRAHDGLGRLYPAADPPLARLDHELAAITRHGYAPLFLVVADIVRFARRHAVPVSTRGSVANSLVAYCLGITTVDPVAHDLLFERFLNPARTSLPDIDLDFCSRRRDRVLAYVRDRYGADRVALVSTVNTLKLKSAVRAAAKADGYDEAAIAALTRRLPSGWHPDPRRRWRGSDADIVARYDSAGDRAVVADALGLVGQPDHLSVHPGGVVITPRPLTDIVPLQWTPKGFVVTQFDHLDVEPLGLPKIDLLGIRALTVLADAADAVRRSADPAFHLDAVPPADPATAAMLAAGDTIGVFQCESAGAQRTLRQLQAHSVADLAVANAFFKPGPATGGMAAAFVRRYRGEAPVTYLHPALEPILAPTKGVLLFQEQILRVTRDVAGLSWAAADQLRRGMSKFDAAAMAALQTAFVDGCRAQSGLTRAQAETLWQQVIAFAGYGFNQGHATAYAVVSYQSAYMKAHFPALFLWARLAVGGGFHHPAIYIAEARRLGIAVRPPHVNHSGRRFAVDSAESTGSAETAATLWAGLGWVRDLRRQAIKAIVAQRPFADLRDLLLRVPLQEKEARHLIQAGALDGLGPSRAALLREHAQLQRAGSAGQLAFDFGEGVVQSADSPAQNLAWEQALLGMPLSRHPAELVAPQPGDVPLATVSDPPHGRCTVVAARLPGWTGSSGFWIGDAGGFVMAELVGAAAAARLPRWQALRLHGRWRPDRWGGGVLAIEQVDALPGAG